MRPMAADTGVVSTRQRRVSMRQRTFTSFRVSVRVDPRARCEEAEATALLPSAHAAPATQRARRERGEGPWKHA